MQTAFETIVGPESKLFFFLYETASFISQHQRINTKSFMKYYPAMKQCLLIPMLF